MIRYSLLIARCSLLIALLMAGAGCYSGLIVAADNYLTYEYAFTDVAAAKARQEAEKLCAARKKMAVETRSVCTLSRCTTDYQCVDPKHPLEFEPDGYMTNQY